MKSVIDELRAGLRTIPRGAVITVAVGLILSLVALAANRTDWEASADLEWVTVEEVEELVGVEAMDSLATARAEIVGKAQALGLDTTGKSSADLKVAILSARAGLPISRAEWSSRARERPGAGCRDRRETP